jgi:hypothetical protein
MVLPLKQEAGAAYLCFSVNRLHLHRLAPSRHQLHSHSGALRFYSLPSLRRGGFQCVYLNGPGFWTGSESLQRTALHCKRSEVSWFVANNYMRAQSFHGVEQKMVGKPDDLII